MAEWKQLSARPWRSTTAGDPLRPAIRAPTAPRSLDPAPADTGLLNGPMIALLVAVALGWSAEMLVQATLPLLILDRGGDAALVGFVVAAYAVPTLLLRPLIGRRIDRTGQGPVHQAGAVLLTLAPLGYLLSATVALPLARFGQGLGWAMYGTANNVLLARLAPPHRRGEASGYFNVSWALGFLVGPPIGLALYAWAGGEIPFVVASLFAAGGLLTATWLRQRVPARVAPTAARPAAMPLAPSAGYRARVVPASSAPVEPIAIRRWLERFVEPAAVPTMVILAAFMAGQTLFLTFASVYIRDIGAPDSLLALYFPIYGVLLGFGQLVTGRLSDRFGRRRTIILGSAIGTVGLVIATMADGWLGFTVGAGWYALGAAVVNPAAAAATMDRLPPERAGVGMATFAMGYQLAAGVGGAAWGLLIARVGFPSPFLVGIALQALCVGLAIRYLSSADRDRRAGLAPASP